MGFNAGSNPNLLLTGERPELGDAYPSLHVYRDIVFFFKFLMMPTSSDLPELRQWTSAESRLTWRIHSGRYEVHAFGKHVKVENPNAGKGFFASMFHSLKQGLGKLGVVATEPRAPPPGSDASAYCGEVVTNEEDVLWVEKLPGTPGSDSVLFTTDL